MKFIKKKVKEIFFRILEQNEKFQKIENIEKNIKRIKYLLHDIYPDLVFFNENIKNIINQFLKAKNIQQTNISVSKNDLMFHFWLFHSQTIESAVQGYFKSGYNQSQILKSIFESKKNNLKDVKILDFASGHGRVVRFLLNFIPNSNIWISEIKESAVEFQKQEFKVNGIVSDLNPDNVIVQNKFDFIVVSSLFTHLPEALFKKWLVKLTSLLSTEGILILSTHFLENSTNLNNFIYRESSEETLFPEIYEGLANDIYGTTYITEEKFCSLLSDTNLNNFNYNRYEKKWENQDLYLLSEGLIPDINF